MYEDMGHICYMAGVTFNIGQYRREYLNKMYTGVIYNVLIQESKEVIGRLD